MSTKTEATVEDLYRVPENGKAEIVNGELVLMSPTGGVPGRASGEIYVSLREYEKKKPFDVYSQACFSFPEPSPVRSVGSWERSVWPFNPGTQSGADCRRLDPGRRFYDCLA